MCYCAHLVGMVSGFLKHDEGAANLNETISSGATNIGSVWVIAVNTRYGYC